MFSDERLIDEFQVLEDQFSIAMVTNDPDQIAKFITDDWALVTQQSGPLSREVILGIIGSGTLTHTAMTKQVTRAKRYGDVAVVTGRNQNSGTYNSQPIEADEWVTDVFVQTDGRWLCAITHISPTIDGTA